MIGMVMLLIVANASRRLRTFVAKFVRFGEKTLYLLSPKQTGKDWRYAAFHQNELVLFGKAVANRDQGRKEAKLRWSQTAKDYRPNRSRSKAA